jgi:hypothetical protein
VIRTEFISRPCSDALAWTDPSVRFPDCGLCFELVKGRNRGAKPRGVNKAECQQVYGCNTRSVAVVCFIQTLLACFIALGLVPAWFMGQVSKRKAASPVTKQVSIIPLPVS